MSRRQRPRRSSHADQTVTDLRVRRVSVASGAGYAALGWDYPGATLLEVRIVRSEREFAREPDDPARAVSQHIAYQGSAGSYRDTAVQAGETYYYTIFARHPGQLEWLLWERFKVTGGGAAGGYAGGASGDRRPLAWVRARLRRLLR